jgi:hypothetical protein
MTCPPKTDPQFYVREVDRRGQGDEQEARAPPRYQAAEPDEEVGLTAAIIG